MARIEILKNVSIDTGMKLQREATITDTTKAMFDFRSVWSGAAKNLNVGNTVKNLAFFDNTLSVAGSGSLTYVGKGMKFTEGAGKLRFSLPDDGVPKYTNTKWVTQFCLKIDKYSQASTGNNQLINIGSATGQTAASSNLSIVPIVGSDQISITGMNLYARGCWIQIQGSTAEFSVIQAAFKANENKLLHVAVSVDVGATTTAVSMYLNGVLAITRNVANPSTSITNTNKDLNANSAFPAHTACTMFRYRFDDLTSSTATITSLVASDYAACVAAFS